MEYENFNAAAVTLTVEGVNIHPGSAKNKMKNAILLANQFISLLPAAEAPAHTEGYEGFYHVTDLAGNESAGGAARHHPGPRPERSSTRGRPSWKTPSLSERRLGRGFLPAGDAGQLL